MRRRDKLNNIEKANILAEQRYLQSKGLISENIKYYSSTINGKEYTSTWAGETDNIEDFKIMIDDIPDTLESIKVTKETKLFNPSGATFNGPITPDNKEEIKQIVQGVDKAFKDDGKTIHTFELSSYYPVSPNTEKDRSAKAYIQYRTKESDEFVKDMSSGKYGSLD
jgi:hypothetical protein